MAGHRNGANPGPTADAAAAEKAAMQDEAEEVSSKLAAIRAEVKQLKGDLAAYGAMEPERRECFCGHPGGYEAAVAQISAKLEELEDCYVRQRGCKTLRQQLISAQSHEDKVAKAARADADKLADILGQLEQLQKDIETQKNQADKSATELVAAKANVNALAAFRVAETAGTRVACEAAAQAKQRMASCWPPVSSLRWQ